MDGWTILTSRKNETVLSAAALREKKARRASGTFGFEGYKLLGEALDAGIAPVRVFATAQAKGAYEELLSRLPETTEKYEVTDEVYRKMTEENAPQGIFTVSSHLDKSVKFTTIYEKAENDVSDRILLCDGLQDPGNVGTVIRGAAAMGFGRLVFSDDCADLYHARTLRGAMGALFRQRIDVTDDMAAYVRSLQKAGRRVFAAALNGHAAILGETPVSADDCFLVGNEGHGLSDALCAVTDGCVRIPMEAGNESYNAAMAATLLMWECYRADRLKQRSHS